MHPGSDGVRDHAAHGDAIRCWSERRPTAPCGTISVVAAWGRMKPILLVPALLTMGLTGCGASGPVETPPNASPITALHDAINALENEPSYTLTVTSSPGSPGGGGTVIYGAHVERPDRIEIGRPLNVIAIGSTAYFKSPTGWTRVHHPGEATNYINDMLMYVNVLKRASTVNRKGRYIYNVPTVEADSLLKTTGLPRFQEARVASYFAVIDRGLIRSVFFHADGSSSIAVRTVVSKIGSSPPVTAPRSG